MVSLPMAEVLEWSPEELNQWIPMFIHEVRKRDGGDYRAKTIMEYVLTLQSAFCNLRGKGYSFLKSDAFQPIRNALDNRMRALQTIGLGHNPSQAEVVSMAMEEALWIGGQLGQEPPSRMLNTLVYLLGVNLGLRSGEHRKLRRNMFQVMACLLCIERCTKLLIVTHFGHLLF
jgi:hypothetical protein